jgi:hypothetical protein
MLNRKDAPDVSPLSLIPRLKSSMSPSEFLLRVPHSPRPPQSHMSLVVVNTNDEWQRTILLSCVKPVENYKCKYIKLCKFALSPATIQSPSTLQPTLDI